MQNNSPANNVKSMLPGLASFKSILRFNRFVSPGSAYKFCFLACLPSAVPGQGVLLSITDWVRRCPGLTFLGDSAFTFSGCPCNL
jgi:hypothetical protein